MPTENCPACKPDEPCGNGHLYVIQLSEKIVAGEGLATTSSKGYLYVGQTGKSVKQRSVDNFTRKDGTFVTFEAHRKDRLLPDEQQKWPEDGKWKYNSSGIKKVRAYFQEYRPDLFYYNINPIIKNKGDKNQMERRESKLGKKLQNRGWRVFGAKLD